ncbi:LysM peptidoglycan-binding domain-containing protein [Indiicoccus explosivorum]|uniref:LysM peptidoglycan-binding domain-containing protein n=1 Tax=Indiicoccus explosivorum TaxID=1917864 RepID=UPI0013904FEF|nr:LysM peptidoglycan-binding domain-containing protein [Indiicoccus explosivorum]
MELNGKARLEGYEIHVSSEDYAHDGEVTSHKTENGLTMNDHVSSEPQVVSLSGLLVRPTEERVQTLINKILDWKKNGTKLQYEGRQIVQNVLIESFKFAADKSTANGYSFSMTLKQVRIAEVEYTPPTKPVTNAGQKQTQNKNESAVYHIVKAGDTFWELSRQYGVSVQKLQSWNTYPARAIPIGVKLRVG